jgi:hypothetical protein
MVVRNGYTGLLPLLGFYLTVIVFFGASLLAWAYYNLARFRGSGRRKQVPVASGGVASERYGIMPERLIEWRGCGGGTRVPPHGTAARRSFVIKAPDGPCAPMPRLRHPSASLPCRPHR